MVANEYLQLGSQQEDVSMIGSKLILDFDFCDVTLVCADNQHLPAHRAVLCASSSFLRELLYDSQQQRTFLYLGRVQHEDMRNLLEFIYLGSCSVQRSRLEDLVRLAADLKVLELVLSSKIYQNIKKENAALEKDNNLNDSLSEQLTSPEKQTDFTDIKEFHKKDTEKLYLVDPSDFHKKYNMEELQSFSNSFDANQYPEKDNLTDNDISNVEKRLFVWQETKQIKYEWFMCEKCNKMYTSQQTLHIHANKIHGIARAKRKVFYIPKTELPEPDANGMYKCDKCEYRSEKKFRFRKHKAVIHEGFLYNCEKCSDSFKSKERMKMHMDSVHVGVEIKCQECSKQFYSQKVLEDHEEQKKKCKDCDYFSCWKKVDKHMSTIHNTYFKNGLYHCEQCSYQTTKPGNIKIHKNRTHNSTLFPCDHCDYKNKSKSAVKNHTDDKHFGITYQCLSCDFIGKTKKKLWSHKEKEHKMKDFPCTDCSYIGKTKRKYQYHRESKHRNENYICSLCNMKFSSKDTYTRHMKHQHESQPMFCDQCSYAAKGRYLLNQHKKKRHTAGLIYQCSECSFLTNQKPSLKSHEQFTHEGIKFECEKYDKQMKTLKTLSDHRIIYKTGENANKNTWYHKALEDAEDLCCESQDCCRNND